MDYRCANLLGLSQFTRKPQDLVILEPNIYWKQKCIFFTIVNSKFIRITTQYISNNAGAYASIATEIYSHAKRAHKPERLLEHSK